MKMAMCKQVFFDNQTARLYRKGDVIEDSLVRPEMRQYFDEAIEVVQEEPKPKKEEPKTYVAKPEVKEEVKPKEEIKPFEFPKKEEINPV